MLLSSLKGIGNGPFPYLIITHATHTQCCVGIWQWSRIIFPSCVDRTAAGFEFTVNLDLRSTCYPTLIDPKSLPVFFPLNSVKIGWKRKKKKNSSFKSAIYKPMLNEKKTNRKSTSPVNSPDSQSCSQNSNCNVELTSWRYPHSTVICWKSK